MRIRIRNPGLHHKVLTYVEYKAVSGVFQNIDPPPPLHPASVSSPRTRRALISLRLQHKTYHVNGGVLVGTSLGGGPGLGLQVEGGDPVEPVHGEGGAATQHVQPLPVAADLVPISEQYVVFFNEVCNCMSNFRQPSPMGG